MSFAGLDTVTSEVDVLFPQSLWPIAEHPVPEHSFLENPCRHVVARNTFPEGGVVGSPTFVSKDIEKAPVNALLRIPASNTFIEIVVATHIRWDAFKGEGATGPILFPHELKHDMGMETSIFTTFQRGAPVFHLPF